MAETRTDALALPRRVDELQKSQKICISPMPQPAPSTGRRGAYSLEDSLLLRGHAARSERDEVLDGCEAVGAEQAVDGGAVLRVGIVHLLCEADDVRLHVRHAVDELLEAVRALLVVYGGAYRMSALDTKKRDREHWITWEEYHGELVEVVLESLGELLR